MAVNGSSQSVHITGTVSTVALSLVAFGFDPGVAAAADRVFISVGANALRVAWDHPVTTNPPTTTAGLRLPTNNFPIFEVVGRENTAALLMIRDGSADATVTVIVETD